MARSAHRNPLRSRRRASPGLRRILPVLPLLLAGCEQVGVEIQRRRPLDPPPEYAGYWLAMVECSGIEGEFTRVRWFAATVLKSNGRHALGLWEPPHDITLREDAVLREDSVRHEMLHDLLQGDPAHEDPRWAACGVAPGGG